MEIVYINGIAFDESVIEKINFVKIDKSLVGFAVSKDGHMYCFDRGEINVLWKCEYCGEFDVRSLPPTPHHTPNNHTQNNQPTPPTDNNPHKNLTIYLRKQAKQHGSID